VVGGGGREHRYEGAGGGLGSGRHGVGEVFGVFSDMARDKARAVKNGRKLCRTGSFVIPYLGKADI
jgi:hypothetical protein